MKVEKKSTFKREQNTKVLYVIHQHIIGLDKKEQITLPYVFTTRQQANRYLENVYGAFMSHGVYTDYCERVYYKVQHLSMLTETIELSNVEEKATKGELDELCKVKEELERL